MKEEGDEDNVEALPCGHTSHRTCLEHSINITGERKVEACPYRCHLSISNIIDDDAEPQAVEPQPTAQPAQPNQDDDAEDAGRGIDIY